MLCSQFNICTRSLSLSCILNIQKKPKLDFGLSKVERKHLRRRISKAHVCLNSNHIYKSSLKINSKYELAEYLKNHEIYNGGGLIALNKPFGVRRYADKVGEEDEPKTVSQTLNGSGNVPTTSIEEALPLLKRHYDNKELNVVLCPDRYASGIMLLSASPNITSRVQKCFRSSLALQAPHQTYWAVVQGLTVPEAVGERVGLGFHHVANVGKVPIIKKSFGRNEVSRGDVKSNVVEHKVIAHHKQNDVSLVQLSVLNARHNFPRVWLSHCFSPIFGDLLFGGRVKTVLGKKIQVSPSNVASYTPPNIPEDLLRSVHLSTIQSELIPLHLHLARLKLFHFNGCNDVIITASPPDHFLWTCRQLGLMSAGEDDAGHGLLEDIQEEDGEESAVFR